MDELIIHGAIRTLTWRATEDRPKATCTISPSGYRIAIDDA